MTHSSPIFFLRRLQVFAASRGAVVVAACGLPFCVASAQQPLLLGSTRAPMHMVAARAEAPPLPPQNGGSSAPIRDDLFAGTEKFAKNATDATEVNMDPESLNLVNGANAGRARKTVLNVVRTYSYDKPGMYNPAEVDEYRHKLETGDWHCSVRSRDLKSGESTDICSRRRPPDMVETAIITVEPKELTFIHTIRKADGQGGHVNGEDPDGISEAMPLSSITLAVEPRLEASMLAMQARMAAMSARLSASRMPSMEALQSQLAATLRQLPDQTRQMEQLQRQLKHMPVQPPTLP